MRLFLIIKALEIGHKLVLLQGSHSNLNMISILITRKTEIHKLKAVPGHHCCGWESPSLPTKEAMKGRAKRLRWPLLSDELLKRLEQSPIPNAMYWDQLVKVLRFLLSYLHSKPIKHAFPRALHASFCLFIFKKEKNIFFFLLLFLSFYFFSIPVLSSFFFLYHFGVSLYLEEKKLIITLFLKKIKFYVSWFIKR